MTGTSITSAPDISIFSLATRSQAPDERSVDTADVESDNGPHSSGLATPLAMPKLSPSPDVVRIFVPYVTTSHSSVHSQSQNSEFFHTQENKIRIQVEEQSSSEDVRTPVIEQSSMFVIETPTIDLK